MSARKGRRRVRSLWYALGVSSVLLADNAVHAESVSPVVIPPPDVPLAFSHADHLDLGIRCVSCHPGGRDSRKAADNLLPEEATCLRCHNVDAPDPAKAFPKASCDTCHPGFEEGRGDPMPVRTRDPELIFPHRTHTILGILCTDCHEGVKESSQPSWSHIPSMALCLDCHNGNEAPRACPTCHPAEPSGRLQTSLPTGTLAPSGRYRDDAHAEPQFLFKHRNAALADPEYCQSCHAQAECQDCHAGADKPTFHENNYALLHAKDAYTDTDTCMTCHSAARDCESCHAAARLTLDRRSGEGAVHPPGWASFAPGPNHHGPYARRSASGCASCHAEEDCIRCHSTRTLRVNPHPPGWASGAARLRTDASCRKCHDTIP